MTNLPNFFGKKYFFEKSNWVDVIFFMFLLSAIFFSKIALIKYFSSFSPFWDQWDAEGLGLYKPYLEGNLTFLDLFKAHSEHRIFFPRLLFLFLLELRGAWDTQLQMIVNSGIQVATIGIFSYFISQNLSEILRLFFLFFVLLVSLLPLSWGNTLFGFQSQFHLSSLFAILSISFFCLKRAFNKYWWFALLFAWMSFFSSAGGSLTFLAAILILVPQLYLRARQGCREIVSIVVIFLCFIITVFITPQVPNHDYLKAQNVWQFLSAAINVFGWPVPGLSPAFFLINLPLMLLIRHTLATKPAITDWQWWALGVGGWIDLQLISLSYGRASAPLASRYLDTVALNVLLNAAIGLWWLSRRSQWRNSSLFRPIMLVWFLLVGISLGYQSDKQMRGLEAHSRTAQIHERAIYRYLSTRDPGALEIPRGGRVNDYIPYPSSERLRIFLDDHTIQLILPQSLNPAFDAAIASKALALNGKFSSYTLIMRNFLLNISRAFLVTSIFMILLCSLRVKYLVGSGRTR